MNLSDYFFLLKRKIINKRNIIFIIILSILVTIILLCISIMYFVNSTYNMLINDIDNRTLIISKPATEEEYQHIEDIKHVLLVTSNKYSDGLSVDVKEFKYDGKEGIVTLEPLLIPADLEIKEGKSITNELEVNAIDNQISDELICDIAGLLFSNKIISDNNFITKK